MTSLRQGLLLGKSGVISLVGAGGKTSLMFSLARELSKSGQTVLTTTTTRIFYPTRKQSTHVIVADSAEEILNRAGRLLQKGRHLTAAAGRMPAAGKLVGFSPATVERLWRAGVFPWIIVEADGAAGRPLKAPAAHEPVVPACTERLVGVIGLKAVGQCLADQWVFRPERFAQITGLDAGAPVTEAAIVTVLKRPNGIFKAAPPAAEKIVFLNQADRPQRLSAGHRIAQLLAGQKPTVLKRIVIGQALGRPPVLAVYDLHPQEGCDG